MRYSKALALISIFLLPGCMTLRQGYQVPDEHPYVRTFDASPAATLDAVHCALYRLHRLPVEEGGQGNPVYTYVSPDFPDYYSWIFTDQKLRFWIAFTTSNELNIFLKPRSETQTDVTVNYEHKRALAPFYDYCYVQYRDDPYVNRLFDEIAAELRRR